LATAIGGVLALGILSMGVGLIRSEAGRDLAALTAAGATSGARRVITAATAGGLTFLAAVLGTVGAYLALVAGYLDEPGPLANVPYVELLLLWFGLPLLAAGAGSLLAGPEPAVLTRNVIE
jgi:putative ABC transport system permease protein